MLKHDGVRYAMDLYEPTNKPVKEICKITNISEAIFYRRWREYQNIKNAVTPEE